MLNQLLAIARSMLLLPIMRHLIKTALFLCCATSPLLPQQLPTAKPRHLLTVPNDELQLTYPGAAVVSPTGDLILADAPSKRVLIVSPTGQLRGTLGGEGRAPGQLLSITRLGIHGDSVLWAADHAQKRLVRWSLKALRHLSTQTIDKAVPGLTAADSVALHSLDAAGNTVLSTTFSSFRGRRASGVGRIWLRASDGTIRQISQTEWRRSSLVLNDGRTLTSQPFADHAQFSATTDGATIYTVARNAGTKNQIAVHRTEARSGRRDSLMLALPDLPLDRRSTDSTIAALAKWFVEIGNYRTSAEARADLRSALYIPAEWPPVTKLLADSRTNTLLLFCRVAGKRPYVWRQVDMTRRAFTREIDLPDNERLIAVDSDLLWTVRSEEDGDISLSRWSIA